MRVLAFYKILSRFAALSAHCGPWPGGSTLSAPRWPVRCFCGERGPRFGFQSLTTLVSTKSRRATLLKVVRAVALLPRYDRAKLSACSRLSAAITRFKLMGLLVYVDPAEIDSH